MSRELAINELTILTQTHPEYDILRKNTLYLCETRELRRSKRQGTTGYCSCETYGRPVLCRTDFHPTKLSSNPAYFLGSFATHACRRR